MPDHHPGFRLVAATLSDCSFTISLLSSAIFFTSLGIASRNANPFEVGRPGAGRDTPKSQRTNHLRGVNRHKSKNFSRKTPRVQHFAIPQHEHVAHQSRRVKVCALLRAERIFRNFCTPPDPVIATIIGVPYGKDFTLTVPLPIAPVAGLSDPV